MLLHHSLPTDELFHKCTKTILSSIPARNIYSDTYCDMTKISRPEPFCDLCVALHR